MTNKKTNKKQSEDVLTQRDINAKWIKIEQDKPTNQELDEIQANKLFKRFQENGIAQESEICDSDEITKIIHRMFSNKTMLHHLVGVQEMSHPVGLVYLLRYVNKDDNSSRMTLEVISRAVKAASRTMNIRWNIDMINDAMTASNIDLLHEILQAATSEICRDLHDDYSDLIYQNSMDVDFRIDTDEDPMVCINKFVAASNAVVRASRRGAANRMVLPYELFMHLLPTMMDQNIFELASTSNQSASDLVYVGKLYNNIKIYSSIRNTVVLIGYKGNNSELDAGIIHSPYQLTPMVFASAAQHTIAIRARYATHVADNAKDYYVSIQVR